MSESDSDIVEIRSRDLKLVGLAFVMMLCSIGLLVSNLVSVANQAATAAETHHGVCVFRQSLQEEVAGRKQYLKQHPDGAPALGISAAQVRQGIAIEEAKVQALLGLHCDS